MPEHALRYHFASSAAVTDEDRRVREQSHRSTLHREKRWMGKKSDRVNGQHRGRATVTLLIYFTVSGSHLFDNRNLCLFLVLRTEALELISPCPSSTPPDSQLEGCYVVSEVRFSSQRVVAHQ